MPGAPPVTICLECGAHTPETVTRGPLTVQIDPPAAFWKGKRLTLRPAQLRVLWALMQRGEMTHLGLQILCTGEETLGRAVDQQICLLRKQMPPEVKIEAIFGWGYRLIVEAP